MRVFMVVLLLTGCAGDLSDKQAKRNTLPKAVEIATDESNYSTFWALPIDGGVLVARSHCVIFLPGYTLDGRTLKAPAKPQAPR